MAKAVAEEQATSAEAVTKLLRDASRSSPERLATAKNLWEHTITFVPGKDDLLLDWTTSEMFNGIKKKELGKQQECPHLHIPFWNFLHSLLEHFAAQKRKLQKLGNWAAGASAASTPLRTYNVRTRMMDVFIALLDDVADLEESDAESLDSPSTFELLRLGLENLQLLASELPEVLRPTLDLHVSLTNSAIRLFLLARRNSGEDQTSSSLALESASAAFLARALKELTSSAVQYPNQKKVFTTCIGKLLLPLFALHKNLSARPVHSAVPTSDLLSSARILVQRTLFHKDHLPEFATVLDQLFEKKGVNLEKAGYPKQLLDHIRKLLEGNELDADATMEALPLLFKLFADSCERYSSLRTSSVPPSFALFYQLQKLIFEGIPAGTEYDATISDRVQRILTVSVTLLESFADCNVYRSTNDASSKRQLSYFQTLFGKLYELIARLPPSHHGQVFRGWGVLLLLDYGIIETHIRDIWPHVLSPADEARDSASSFICVILATFTKARSLNILIEDYLRAIRTLQLDSGQGADRIVFSSSAVFDELARCSERLLPVQAIELIRMIADTLMQQYLPSTQDQPPTKKRKTGKGSKAVAEKKALDGSGRSAELPVSLLCTILQHSQISQGQRAAYDQIVAELHLNFIQRMLSSSGDYELYPALSLQLTLVKYAPDYWGQHISTAGVTRMMERLRPLSKQHPKIAYLKDDIALCHVDRIASTCVDPLGVAGCDDIVREIIAEYAELSRRAKFHRPKGASWDGRVSSITEENAVVALWGVIANHLPAISRLAGEEDVKFAVNTILNSLEHTEENSALGPSQHSMRSVSFELLRSTAFYELRAIRNILVPGLIKRIQTVFADPSTDMDFLVALGGAVEFGSGQRSEEEALQYLQNVLSVKSPLVDDPERYVKEALPLVTALSALPSSYFSVAERDAMIFIAINLELPLSVAVLQKPTYEREQPTKTAIAYIGLCRSLLYRYMRAREDRAVNLFSPTMLRVYLMSATAYRASDLQHGMDNVVKTTFMIEELVCRKALQRGSTPQAKGPTATEYLEAVKAAWKSTYDDMEKFNLAAHVMRPILSWLEARKKRSAKSDAPLANAETDSGLSALVQGFEAEVFKTMGALTIPSEDDMEVDRPPLNVEGCKTARAALEVFQLVLKYHHFEGDAHGDKLMMFLAPLLTGAMQLLRASPTEAVGDLALHAQITLLVADLLAVFSANIKELTSFGTSDAIRSICQLLEFIMGTASTSASQADEAIETCAKCLGSLVRETSKEQYLALTAYFLDKLEREPSRISVFVADNDAPVRAAADSLPLIKAVHLILTGENRAVGRSVVKKALPNLLAKLAQVLQVTTSFPTAMEILHLLTRASMDKYLKMRHSDVAFILGAVAAITANSSGLRDAMPLRKGGEAAPKEAVELFDAVYRLLLALLKFRKELLVPVIPSLIGLIRDLLMCFRKRTGGEVNGPRTARHHAKSDIPTTWDVAQPFTTTTQLPNASSLTATSAPAKLIIQIETVSLLAQYAPFPTSSASDLSRILVALGQKAQLSERATTSTSATTTTASAATAASATVKPIMKHAPFLLSTILHIQASVRPFPADVKAALMEGIYTLLDLCGDHGREAVLAALDPHGGSRPLLKAMVADWEAHHRYTGKI
ncbi:Urb2/Npa2 family-domain-containing protein [Fimicolochytrium jonesii]|uniref:Urb2/Npa2 family-domain-containing protein n=1 Tax=Fimicolochytrium jonesii TaxID=1396493 RepID=UPI0022FE9F20|nr:Urb2/Npa2 family-domain-containing protein [Fimicolochytrium jonesii]KAI8817730.1 Urb2/Npa2 family-domain-containing protein [Fimicolochytrium jonesii]